MKKIVFSFLLISLSLQAMNQESQLAESSQEHSPLSQALRSGNPAMVASLIAAGANVNEIKPTGESILCDALACIYDNKQNNIPNDGQKAAVKVLLCHNPDVNIVSEFGTPAINWAIRIEDIELLELLLNAQAKPKESSAASKWICFIEAGYKWRNINAMRLLLAANEDLSFDFAILGMDRQMERIFTNYKSKLSFIENNPKCALRIAIICGYTGLIKTLLGQSVLRMSTQELDFFLFDAKTTLTESIPGQNKKVVRLIENYREIFEYIQAKNLNAALNKAVEQGFLVAVKVLLGELTLTPEQFSDLGKIAKEKYQATGYSVYKDLGLLFYKQVQIIHGLRAIIANGSSLPEDIKTLIARHALSVA